MALCKSCELCEGFSFSLPLKRKYYFTHVNPQQCVGVASFHLYEIENLHLFRMILNYSGFETMLNVYIFWIILYITHILLAYLVEKLQWVVLWTSPFVFCFWQLPNSSSSLGNCVRCKQPRLCTLAFVLLEYNMSNLLNNIVSSKKFFWVVWHGSFWQPYDTW